jgi:hypothetical protein
MTTITALPDPPSRADPANFAARGDAFLGALPTFVTEVNQVGAEVTAASGHAATATTQAGIATTAAGTATTQAGIATTAAGTATTQAGLAATAKTAAEAAEDGAQAAQAAAEALVGSAVTSSGTQTLTNKTIQNPTVTQNLNFSGTGNRITGDFSNATIPSRVMFQTSTVNGATSIGLMPNGSGGGGGINIFTAPDPANASLAQVLAIPGSDIRFTSSLTGTGAFLPMTFHIGGAERLRIDTSGTTTLGGTSTAPAFKVIPVASQTSWLTAVGSSTGYPYIFADGPAADLGFTIQAKGAGSVYLVAGGLVGAAISPTGLAVTGNLLVTSPAGLGYGTGAGGYVEQATSKSTAVTLNKPCGQITMHNAALAVNAIIGFTVWNSIVSPSDSVIVSVQNPVSGDNYRASVVAVGSGSFRLLVQNIGVVSLTDAVVLNFAIIRGAAS